MRLRLPFLFPLALLAACSSSHPLDGAWNEERADGKAGMTIEFEVTSTRCMVHTAPGPDGSHEHLAGTTYTFDAAAGTVTVKAPLLGKGKADSWSGKLAGEHLELGSADGKLVFHRGAHAHGH